MTKIELNTGKEMPNFGFGTWNLQEGEEAISAVDEALRTGYRLVDTARIYGNEASVGRAIIDSDVDREEIFVTTKLWNSDQGYDSALQAFDLSLQRLGLEYIDLYLIHWPGHNEQARHDSWRALVDINKTGKARSIGVSNFRLNHLRALKSASDVVPAVNQIEFHPFVFNEQRPVWEYCKQNGIALQAYSPLAGSSALDSKVVTSLADELEKSQSQILLRWCIQHDTVPIPKSAHPARIKENFDVFDFELNKNQMEMLDRLGY